MFNADVLTFREFMMSEPLPLATMHNAVLEFLRGRGDVVVFGAQAVNAYVDEPRMTQALDLMSIRAQSVAEELSEFLHERFHIAVRLRKVGQGRGLRLFQTRKSGSRHLVDLRSVESLPAAERIADVLVMAPPDLIASKVVAYHQRRGQPKSGTDWRDLAMLLLKFPDLKQDSGPVLDRLKEAGATTEVLEAWKEFVARGIQSPDESDEF